MSNLNLDPYETETQIRGAIFQIGIYITLAAGLVLFGAAFLFDDVRERLVIGGSITVLTSLILLGLHIRGQWKPGTLGLVIVVLIITSWSVWTGGGLDTPEMFAYAVVALYAVLFFGIRGGIITGSITLLTTLGLAVLQTNQQLPASSIIYTPSSQWTLFAIAQIASIGLMSAGNLATDRAIRRLRQAMLTKQQAQNELLQLNTTLEQHVAARTAELEQANKQLQESETRFREVLENSLDASYKRNLRTNSYAYLSPVFANITGYTPEEMKSLSIETVLSLMHPNDIPEVNRVIAESMSGTSGMASQLTYRFKCKDGQYRWLLDRFALLYGADGQPLARIGSVSDITERKQSEEALRESEANLRAVFNATDESIYLIAADETLLALNDIAAQRLGRPRKELLGHKVMDLLPPEVGAHRRPFIDQAIGKGEQVRFEDMRNGRWMSNTLQPIFETVGQVARLAVYSRDMTERKQMEEALRESEARWQFALEGAGDGVWDWNTQTNQVYFSCQWKAMLGFEPDEIGDSLDEWDKRIHPADREQVYAKLNQHLEKQTAFYTSEHRVQCKDGSYKWILDRGRVVRYTDDGKPQRIVGTHTDITERKQIEEALRESEAKYRLLFENMQEGFSLNEIITDKNGNTIDFRFLDANAAYERHTGLSPQKIIGKTMREILPHADPRQIENYGKVALTGEPLTFEYYSKTFNRHFHVRAFCPQPGRFASIFEDITARKQIEQALQTSQANLLSLIENTDARIWSVDAESRLIVGNSVFHKFVQEARGKRFEKGDCVLDDGFPPDVLDQWRSYYARALGGETFRVETQTRFANPPRTIEYRFYPMKTPAGQMIGATVYEHDITERKQAEKELQESETKFRAIIEQSSEGILLINEQGYIIEWNRAQEQITGILRTTAVGSLFWEIQPSLVMPSHRSHFTTEYFKQSIRKILDTGCLPQFNRTIEMPIVTSSGETKIISPNVFPIKTNLGYRMGIIIHDITARKQIEQDLKDQRDFVTQVINAMGQGLTVTDANQRFVLVNPTYAKLFGYQPEDLIGKQTTDVTAIADHVSLNDARTARRRGETTTYESHLVRADGTIAPVLVTGAPRWVEGKVAGTIAVITDLSEIKHAEENLRDANLQLKKQNDELQALQLQLREQATRDPLTQLFNRRYLNETLPREIARESRQNQNLGVLMIDLDHFKNLNDTYGHTIGDEALQNVAHRLVRQLRASDIVCRYGGEEILCLLPDTTLDDTLVRAEQLRAHIAQAVIVPSNPDVRVTVSIGVALFPAHGTNMIDLLKAADTAMYQAKTDGRNCVHLAQTNR